LDKLPSVVLRRSDGIQATLLNAEISGEFILASSLTPPDCDNGPTASTQNQLGTEAERNAKVFASGELVRGESRR
jgi:hypothetical protein